MTKKGVEETTNQHQTSQSERPCSNIKITKIICLEKLFASIFEIIIAEEEHIFLNVFILSFPFTSSSITLAAGLLFLSSLQAHNHNFFASAVIINPKFGQ